MPHNTALDSLLFNKLDFSYNKIENELSPKPRFVSGYNTYVTTGGKLTKRPGTISLPNSLKTGYRIDRLWNYETLENPSKVFIIGSLFNLNTNMWELHYYRPSATSPAWTQVPQYRQINNSSQAHEGNVFKGLFYVKGFPTAASGEKLGTVIFDGISLTVKPWGLLPPTVPCAISGAVSSLVSNIGSADVTLTVTTSVGFPAVPFNIQLDFELMTVTAQVGNLWSITRGVNGTTASAHTAPNIIVWRNWNPSAHQVTVNIGWAYTYAYKSITGQYSNRAPLETNLDKLPSRTGPFQNQLPRFIVTGNADTVNIPSIGIFRSTDGGGTYYFLQDIANIGGVPYSFEDRNFATGTAGTLLQDPIPDEILNTGVIAPTLTSNSPPPAVITPQVTGIDTPISSTPIVSYNGRQWYAVGNILFYSGNEEISTGIPEESFPSGIFGNFFRTANPILNLSPTTKALYVCTNKNIELLTGSNRETFNLQPNFDNIGHPYGHPRAINRFGEKVAILTQDLRVGVIENGDINIITDPLGSDISDGVNLSNLEYDIKYFADNEKEWLFVSGHSKADSTLSRQWVFDIKKSAVLGELFWQTPWRIRISATYSDRIYENSTQRKFVVAHYNGTSCNLAYLDTSLITATDAFLGVTTGYNFEVKTHLMTVPSGNHVNVRREPAVTPVTYAITLDRITFPGDTDPIINYYLDDLWTQPIPGIQYEVPARRKESVGYKTLYLGIDKVCQRVALQITKISPNERFEAQGLTVMWAPDLGA